MMGSAYHGETYEAVLSPRPVQQSKRRSVKYSYHKERPYRYSNTRVPLRNSDKVLIRLNVIADENADKVLEIVPAHSQRLSKGEGTLYCLYLIL